MYFTTIIKTRFPYIVFDVLDDDYDGEIATYHLGMAMRTLGLFPTEAEVRELTKEIDPQNTGKIDMGDFFVHMARKLRDSADVVQSAKNAFKKISFQNKSNQNPSGDNSASPSSVVPTSRTINLQSLINSLTDEAGEPLSGTEVDSFIQSIPKEAYSQGDIQSEALDKILFSSDRIDNRKADIVSKAKL